MISFDATIEERQGQLIICLPQDISYQLPSRGQLAANGQFNHQQSADIIVEPDGRKGHWVKIPSSLGYVVANGEPIHIDFDLKDEWPEPHMPADFVKELSQASEEIQFLWKDITSHARWDWLRWVNATRNPDTRTKRIRAALSKMESGKRRPCCFNLAGCTDPDLTKNGQLILSA